MTVRAGGGLVVRDGEVLLVHRPKYDDWTFPKGKAEAGESDEDCALREVWEETGLHCALGSELAATEYADALGRPKIVRWWLMEPLSDDGFTPGHGDRRGALADAGGRARAAVVRARPRAARRASRPSGG